MLGVTVAAAGLMALGAGKEAPASAVQTYRVALGNVEQVLALDGVLGYETEFAAVSPSAGVVEAVYVQPGDRVQAGQALFRLSGQGQAQAVAAAVSTSSAASIGTELAQVQLQQLEQLTVRAAAEGLVQQVQVSPYSGVAAGAAAVLLTGEQQVIRCNAVLADGEKLSPGMQARVMHNGACLTCATVGSIGPAQASQTTGQTLCQVQLTPVDNLSLPMGAAVEVEIILESRQQVPVVPVQAITQGGTLWWVADGRSYEMPAQVLLADGVCCWVPLAEGTEVICNGDGLVEGGRVKEMNP